MILPVRPVEEAVLRRGLGLANQDQQFPRSPAVSLRGKPRAARQAHVASLPDEFQGTLGVICDADTETSERCLRRISEFHDMDGALALGGDAA